MVLATVALGAAFLVAAVVVLLAARRFAERGYERRDRYRAELFDTEMRVLARLQEASQIRDDLMASVSHEFRTPLTAIRGSAATLAARGDRICEADRELLLAGIVEHADRLGRLLEDMLLAASARVASDSAAVADVTSALADFRLGPLRPAPVVDVEAGLAAYVDGVSLGQIVQALADHVRSDARTGGPVTLRARREAAEVVIDLLYTTTRGAEDLRGLFEPFGSREAARSGRPASLALYVARRLVEACGGRTSVGRDDGDRVRVHVALRALRLDTGGLPGPRAEGSEEPGAEVEPAPA